MTGTETLRSSVRQLANSNPAVPAPTMMKSIKTTVASSIDEAVEAIVMLDTYLDNTVVFLDLPSLIQEPNHKQIMQF